MTGLRPLALGAVLALGACNGAGAYGSPGGSSVGTKNVSVTNDAFTPVTVRPNDAGLVVWTWNSGGVVHHIVFEDTTIASPGDQSSGTFSHTFTTPGTYRYRCTIHSTAFGSGMHGTVVLGVAAPPDTGGGYGY